VEALGVGVVALAIEVDQTATEAGIEMEIGTEIEVAWERLERYWQVLLLEW